MSQGPTTPESSAARKSPWPLRIALMWGGLMVVIAIAVLAAVSLLSNPLPDAVLSTEADTLAREMQRAVNTEAWRRTGAVSWTFAGQQRHLWDRQRQFVRVEWPEHDVILDLSTREGLARRNGKPVTVEETPKLLDKAWALWCNDSFWLNPIDKLFDEGTERAIAELDSGQRGLLITYGSGGVTPGDRYLWLLGEDSRPTAWRMWTEILPIQGLEASWEGWIELETGASVATTHQLPIIELRLSDVRGAATLAELIDGEDPFRPLELLRGSK
ncbi:MAG: hypothetical protein AAF725_26515 [Acidobacteriota bacterium]